MINNIRPMTRCVAIYGVAGILYKSAPAGVLYKNSSVGALYKNRSVSSCIMPVIKNMPIIKINKNNQEES